MPAHTHEPSSGRTFNAGWWYPPDGSSTDNTVGIDATYAQAAPFSVGKATLFDRIGIEVTTLAAGSTVRLGIYADAGGRPGALILDCGTVDSSTTGGKTITISQRLAAGQYWLVTLAIAGTPSIRGRGGTPDGRVGFATFPASNEGCVRQSGLTTALPDPFSVTPDAVVASTPKIMLRAA